MENTFRDCKNLVSITNLPSKLKDMGKTFQGCKSLVDVPQIPDGVINMNSAFRNDINLNPSHRLVIPKTCKNLMETFENAILWNYVRLFSQRQKFITFITAFITAMP